MTDLISAIQDLFFSLVDIIASLFSIVLPWAPLIAWIAFWLLAVDWSKLYPIMRKGGWIGFVLLAFMMIMVWGAVAPPVSGSHSLFGLKVSNYVGKTVYVTMLFSIIQVCGSVQLSGVVKPVFPADAEPEHGHASGH